MICFLEWFFSPDPPRLQASGIQVASVGDSVELKCTVKANPKPKMLFWRDHDGRIPVIQGANYDMLIADSESVSSFNFFFYSFLCITTYNHPCQLTLS